mmetsp:Transcript_13078/g.51152  ORF Transcript_13078/g.51152 Transcript_13078/m.51152 type:complete len:252 (-) Transcript_13078:930-1685(-)
MGIVARVDDIERGRVARVDDIGCGRVARVVIELFRATHVARVESIGRRSVARVEIIGCGRIAHVGAHPRTRFGAVPRVGSAPRARGPVLLREILLPPLDQIANRKLVEHRREAHVRGGPNPRRPRVRQVTNGTRRAGDDVEAPRRGGHRVRVRLVPADAVVQQTLREPLPRVANLFHLLDVRIDRQHNLPGAVVTRVVHPKRNPFNLPRVGVDDGEGRLAAALFGPRQRARRRVRGVRRPGSGAPVAVLEL